MPLAQLTSIFQAPNLDRRYALEQACIYIQQLVPKANLVSLWRFEEGGRQIRSLINYDAESKTFSSDLILTRDSYPKYFQSIVENEVINAPNARQHFATNGFTESYFKPADIYSLLDFILHKNLLPSGVICCERRGSVAQWTDEDVNNISMVATLISFFFDF